MKDKRKHTKKIYFQKSSYFMDALYKTEISFWWIKLFQKPAWKIIYLQLKIKFNVNIFLIKKGL